MIEVTLPNKLNVGGHELNLQMPERIDGNQLGQCAISEGFIKIAQYYNTDRGDIQQSESSKENTFYHELLHAILSTMGKEDLNNDEEFVCTFASFLCSSMQQLIRIKF